MNSRKAVATCFVSLVLAAAAHAQVPQMINYQGRVTIGGTNYDGTGQFKFALVDDTGAATFWSTGSTPLEIPVSKGAYAVLLGDAGMSPIPATVFTNADVRLRVWFGSATNNIQQLSPDQRIASVGYAMMADNVPDGAITTNKLAPGLATPANTANTVVMRDASGNVAVQSISAQSVGLPGSVSLTVQHITDPESNVHSNTLVFATGEGTKMILDQSGMLVLFGKLVSEGSIDCNGAFWATSISTTGSINTTTNIWAAGEISSGTKVSSWGDIHAGGNLSAGGNVSAHGDIMCEGTKYFIQPHPSDLSKEIAYVCLEGPEAGTYVRGSAELVNGEAIVRLPDHFGMVTSTNALTVQLTPRGAWLQLYATDATVAGITVREASGRNGKFDYLVQGVRLGYENSSVIRERRK